MTLPAVRFATRRLDVLERLCAWCAVSKVTCFSMPRIDEHSSSLFPAELRHLSTPCAIPLQLAVPTADLLEKYMFDKSHIDLIATVVGLLTTVFTTLAGHATLGRKPAKFGKRPAAPPMI